MLFVHTYSCFHELITIAYSLPGLMILIKWYKIRTSDKAVKMTMKDRSLPSIVSSEATTDIPGKYVRMEKQCLQGRRPELYSHLLLFLKYAHPPEMTRQPTTAWLGCCQCQSRICTYACTVLCYHFSNWRINCTISIAPTAQS